MNLMPKGYDAWALRGPDEQHEVGTEAGEVCGRCAEPDEDAPHGYRPKPCRGVIVIYNGGEVGCNECGEMAE